MSEAHEILGVAADADPIEIRAAYVTRLRTAHPDVGGGGEAVSEIVRAYRALRTAALRKRRNGIGSTSVVPIAMRFRRGVAPPVATPSRAASWGRGTALVVLFIAIGAAVYASSRLPSGASPLRVDSQRDPLPHARGPLWAEIDSVDEDVLRDAIAAVRSFTISDGAAELEEHSRRCFSVLAQAPNLRLLDYCLAFDSAATSLIGSRSTARAGAESFFQPGPMRLRHDAALQLLLPEPGAAQARQSEVEAMVLSELVRATRI